MDDVVAGAPFANETRVVLGARTPSRTPAELALPTVGGSGGFGTSSSGALRVLELDRPDPGVEAFQWRLLSANSNESPWTRRRLTLPEPGMAADATLAFVSLHSSDTAPGALAWARQSPPARDGTESLPVLTWLDEPEAGATVFKAHNVTLKRGVIDAAPAVTPGSSPFEALMVWGPGQSTVEFHSPAGGAPLSPALDIEFSALAPVQDGNRSGADLVAAVAADGSAIVIYGWSGGNQLQRLDTLAAPAGERFASALGLGPEGLVALGTANGADSMAFYERRSGRFERVYSEKLPERRNAPSGARVVVFDANPFLHPSAREVERFDVGDWTRDARIEDGVVHVTVLTLQDPLQGLGNATLEELIPSAPLPMGAVALANQPAPHTSLSFGKAPTKVGAPAVAPQPRPGSYPRAIQVTLESDASTTVHYRVGSSPWTQGRGPVVVSESATLEYYGVDVTGKASPTARGHYYIAEAAHAPAGSLREDADGDGMDDAWENLIFGSTRGGPDADSDGDGYSDLAEYLGGGHPLNANSLPASSHLRFIASIELAETGVRIRWSGAPGESYEVQVADALPDWSPAGGLIVSEEGKYLWTDSEVGGTARFYRVMRRN
jgi:hypothetical protein